MAAVDEGSPRQAGSRQAGYRRSAGTPRGEARRRDLLDRVVDDLAVNGLVDFSLTLAARVRAVWTALVGEESRVLDREFTGQRLNNENENHSHVGYRGSRQIRLGRTQPCH